MDRSGYDIYTLFGFLSQSSSLEKLFGSSVDTAQQLGSIVDTRFDIEET